MLEKQILKSHIPLYLILILGGLGLLLLVIPTVCLRYVMDMGLDSSQSYMILAIGIVLLLLLLGYGKYINKDMPNVRITTQKVVLRHLFQRKKVLFSDIHSVHINEMRNQSLLWMRFPVETVVIRTKTQGEMCIRPGYYTNATQLCQAFETIAKDPSKLEKLQFRTSEVLPNEVANEHFEAYKGSGLININTFMLFGFTGFLLYVFASADKDTPITPLIVAVFVIVLLFWGIGFKMHYFLVSEHYFQVRNHFWFWERRTFKLSAIDNIIFDEPRKASKTLRLHTKDYETLLFQAGSLREKHWKALKQALSHKKVKVDDWLKYIG